MRGRGRNVIFGGGCWLQEACSALIYVRSFCILRTANWALSTRTLRTLRYSKIPPIRNTLRSSSAIQLKFPEAELEFSTNQIRNVLQDGHATSILCDSLAASPTGKPRVHAISWGTVVVTYKYHEFLVRPHEWEEFNIQTSVLGIAPDSERLGWGLELAFISIASEPHEP